MGKKSSAPPPPDYTALAKQQADLNQQAADKALMANRSNQVTNQGSLTWTQDPTSGQWTQKISLSPEEQQLYDAQMQQQTGLIDTTNQAQQRVSDQMSTPFDTSGMTQISQVDPSTFHAYGADPTQNADQMQKFDPSQLSSYGNLDYSNLGAMPDAGFGAVEDVQKAMLARTQPALDQQRAQAIQRMKAQGYSDTDEAMNNANRQLDQKDVDAQNQALLGATSAYGDIFNRGMQARQEGATEDLNAANFANSTRAQQANEQLAGGGFNNNVLQAQFGQQQAASAYANALRQQQLQEQTSLNQTSAQNRTQEMNEALTQRELPMNEYKALTGMDQAATPTFSNYAQTAGAPAADVAGAAQKQYQAEVDAANAKAAASAGMVGGLLKTVGGVAGSFFGPLGTAAGSALGGMLAPKADIVNAQQMWTPNAGVPGGLGQAGIGTGYSE